MTKWDLALGTDCESLEQKKYEFLFFQPLEAQWIDVYLLLPLLSEIFRGYEFWRMSWQGWEGDEGIRWDMIEDTIFFRQGIPDGMYAVADFWY